LTAPVCGGGNDATVMTEANCKDGGGLGSDGGRRELNTTLRDGNERMVRTS